MCTETTAFVKLICSFLNNASVGAFIGSFSAFMFGIVAYDYTKRREKWKLHHDAIVKLEYLLNRHLNQISGNIFLLKGALEAYKKSAFSENVLSPIENPELILEMHNLEIINIYMDYQSLVEKVNHDSNAWNRSSERLFTAAFSGNVRSEDIENNKKALAQRSEQLIQLMDDLLQETYTTGSYIKEFLKEDKRPRFANLDKVEKITISKERVETERKKFVKESEDTMKKDREGRLKKYMN